MTSRERPVNRSRWQRVKHLYEGALEQELSQRTAYLKKACGGDEVLRQEVESLLAQRVDTGSRKLPLESMVMGLADHQARTIVGNQLGSYQVIGPIGKGGMGEVYEATDSKLGREVAIKILPIEYRQDPERLERFNREARAVAALNHPNIVTIHSLEEADQVQFITMELVQGRPLSELIPQEGCSLEKFFEVAIPLSDAISAAHQRGITHRDLKPANIMVSEQNQVKVLDFGLAKLKPGPGSELRLTVDSVTGEGRIVGTVPYMSPEQAEGKPVDHRSDIFSLGIILYEMVTGERPFKGDTDLSLRSAILRETPQPVTERNHTLPYQVQRIIRRCLAKDPARRFQTALDLHSELVELKEEVASGEVLSVDMTRSRVKQLAEENKELRVQLEDNGRLVEQGRRLAWRVVAGLAVVMGVIWVVWPAGEPVQTTRVTRFALSHQGAYAGVISPNGRHIAFRLRSSPGRSLAIQDLDQDEPRMIEDRRWVQKQFWSPGSDFVGFFNNATSTLEKVPVGGGSPIEICKFVGLPGGGTWSPDGKTIVFSAGNYSSPNPLRLYEVSARGGLPTLLFEPREAEKDWLPWSPHFLPLKDGRRVLLFTAGTLEGNQILNRIFLRNLETGDQMELARGSIPVYSPSGHVIYRYMEPSSPSPDLWALPFSIGTLRPRGSPFRLAMNVGKDHGVSTNGTLVYTGLGEFYQGQLVWRDRSGNQVGVVGQPGKIRGGAPVISPSGRRALVLVFQDIGKSDLWVQALDRPARTRVTIDKGTEGRRGVWSPAGDRVTFSWKREESWGIYEKRADGLGEPRELYLFPPGDSVAVGNWSPDGRYLLFHREEKGNIQNNIWYLQRKEGGGYEPFPFIRTPLHEGLALFSPDGKLVAYGTGQTREGDHQIFLTDFPEARRRIQVSTAAGYDFRWGRKGDEIIYRGPPDASLTSVKVTTSPKLSVSQPEILFKLGDDEWDVAADGRFLTIKSMGSRERIRVVQNWFASFSDQQ